MKAAALRSEDFAASAYALHLHAEAGQQMCHSTSHDSALSAVQNCMREMVEMFSLRERELLAEISALRHSQTSSSLDSQSSEGEKLIAAYFDEILVTARDVAGCRSASHYSTGSSQTDSESDSGICCVSDTMGNGNSNPAFACGSSHRTESLLSPRVKPLGSFYLCDDVPERLCGTPKSSHYLSKVRPMLSTKPPPRVAMLICPPPTTEDYLSDNCVTTAVQTDPISLTDAEDDEERCLLNDVKEAVVMRQKSDSALTTQRRLFPPLQIHSTMDRLEMITEGFIDDTDPDDRMCTVEFEEVTLQKNTPDARLGLTLCYSSGEDIDTDIFIGEIETQSIAGRDGRIKAGDQILQINGVDVHTRNEAIRLFREDRKDITILIARPTPDREDDVMFGGICPIEEEECALSPCPCDPIMTADRSTKDEDDGDRNSAGSAQEKDSGISRTTDSEPEASISPRPDSIPIVTMQPPSRSVSKYSYESATSANSGKEQSTAVVNSPASAHSAELMTTTPSDVAGSSAHYDVYDYARLPSVSGRLYRSESEGSLARELAYLHREMQHIQLECDKLVERYAKNERRVRQQVERANQLMSNLDHFAKIPPSRQSPGIPDTSNTSSPCQTRCSPRINGSKHTPPLPPHWISNQKSPKISAVNQLRRSREESSSAYNTGESCRSTPLNCASQVTPPHTRRSLDSNGLAKNTDRLVSADGKRDSAMYTLPPGCCMKDCATKVPPLPLKGPPAGKPPGLLRTAESSASPVRQYSPVQMRSKSVDKENVTSPAPRLSTQRSHGPADLPLKRSTMKPDGQMVHIGSPMAISVGDIVHTTPEKLQETMLQQQRVLREAMIAQAKQLRSQHTLSHGPVSTQNLYEEVADLDPVTSMKVEWKVKRRSDGSRYITRRPVRNKLLRERAVKLCTERAGITTDDDAMSELKVGRYWTKEERKKQLERARQRKRRQEELLRHKAEQQALLLQQQDGEHNIVALSNQKMMRQKKKLLMDRFTTVQEFLAHGNKSAEPNRALGILSVTTV